MTRRQRLAHLVFWIVTPMIVAAIILIAWQHRDRLANRLSEPAPTTAPSSPSPPAAPPATGGRP